MYMYFKIATDKGFKSEGSCYIRVGLIDHYMYSCTLMVTFRQKITDLVRFYYVNVCFVLSYAEIWNTTKNCEQRWYRHVCTFMHVCFN